MGIDGIEFHPDYHQNLGTIQEVWLFQIFCLKSPPTGNPFFETLGSGEYHQVMNTIVPGSV